MKRMTAYTACTHPQTSIQNFALLTSIQHAPPQAFPKD